MRKVEPDSRELLREQEGREADERMGWEMTDHIDKHGPFDPYDTTFATGHWEEDRWVWFDFLTVTLEDIWRECAVPLEHRERLAELHKHSACDFVERYRGPLNGTIPLLEA